MRSYRDWSNRCLGFRSNWRRRLTNSLDRFRFDSWRYSDRRCIAGFRRNNFASLLGNSLLGLLGFRWLLGPGESIAFRLATDAIGLWVFNARRVAFDANAERDREIKRLFVCHSKFFGQLVEPDVLRQNRYLSSTLQDHPTHGRVVRTRWRMGA